MKLKCTYLYHALGLIMKELKYSNCHTTLQEVYAYIISIIHNIKVGYMYSPHQILALVAKQPKKVGPTFS
jgi:hypothetical protein